MSINQKNHVCFLINNAGKAVYLANEVNAANFGLTLDYGHALFAHENAAESLCLMNRAGKLFNVHLMMLMELGMTIQLLDQ